MAIRMFDNGNNKSMNGIKMPYDYAFDALDGNLKSLDEVPNDLSRDVINILRSNHNQIGNDIRSHEIRLKELTARKNNLNHEYRFREMDCIVLDLEQACRISDWATDNEDKVAQKIVCMPRGAIIIKGVKTELCNEQGIGNQFCQTTVFGSDGCRPYIFMQYFACLDNAVMTFIESGDLIDGIKIPNQPDDKLAVWTKDYLGTDNFERAKGIYEFFYDVMAFIAFYPKIVIEKEVKIKTEKVIEKRAITGIRKQTVHVVDVCKRIVLNFPPDYKAMTKKQFNYFLGEWSRIGHFRKQWVLPDYFERHPDSKLKKTGEIRDKYIAVALWVDAVEVHRKKENKGEKGVKKYHLTNNPPTNPNTKPPPAI